MRRPTGELWSSATRVTARRLDEGGAPAERESPEVLVDRPRVLLRLEGLALFAAALTLYFHEGRSWVLLVALILVPDLAFAGYALGPRRGAAFYNTLHTTALPIGLGIVGVLADRSAAVAVALIWLAHIGGDRMIGYGLKYPSAFKDTHLQRV